MDVVFWQALAKNSQSGSSCTSPQDLSVGGCVGDTVVGRLVGVDVGASEMGAGEGRLVGTLVVGVIVVGDVVGAGEGASVVGDMEGMSVGDGVGGGHVLHLTGQANCTCVVSQVST